MVYQRPRGGRHLEKKESAFRQESLSVAGGLFASARFQPAFDETPKKSFHTGILRELKRNDTEGPTAAIPERHLRVPGTEDAAMSRVKPTAPSPQEEGVERVFGFILYHPPVEVRSMKRGCFFRSDC